MTKSTGKKRFHFKSVQLNDPAVKRFGDWLPTNRGFFANFRDWLKAGGYQSSALQTFSAAVRFGMGLLDKPYWVLDPQTDIQRMRDHLATRPLTPQTRRQYNDGLNKLAEYLCHRNRKPLPPKTVNWSYYLGTLPDGLTETVRGYVRQAIRARRAADERMAQLETVRPLTAPLRWMVAHGSVTSLENLTPELWYGYLEAELARGIQPVTLNRQLTCLLNLVRFANETDEPICHRLLLVRPLHERQRLPKDAPLDHVRAVWAAIETTAESAHRLTRRRALMDRTWFLLMLHSGLRSSEVRRLRFTDIDFSRRQARIEQSKGLKDRFVPLTRAALAALQDYWAVRGPHEALPPTIFVDRHQPLGRHYFQIRLRNYGKMTGFQITPHQLRHTCATLLLNAGAPILVVQAVLGHKWVTTTLGYARLYDGTVAADYYCAMAQIEKQLPLIGDVVLLNQVESQPNAGKLLALVDSLREGTLNESQSEKLHLLRAGILALAEGEQTVELLKSE